MKKCVAISFHNANDAQLQKKAQCFPLRQALYFCMQQRCFMYTSYFVHKLLRDVCSRGLFNKVNIL